jgi:AraC-like DNA-binding protein
MDGGEIKFCYNNFSYRMDWEHCADRIYHQTFVRGEICPAHTHPSYHLILVTGGSCGINFEGYPPMILPANALLMINPGIRHQFTFEQSDISIHSPLIWRFYDDNGGLLTEPLQKLIGIADRSPFFMRVLSPFQADDFLRQHRDMERYFWKTSRYLKSAKLFSLLMLGVELLFEWNWRKESADTSTILKDKVLSLIDLYYRKDDFTPESLAAELDRSLHYLNSVMIKHTGCGVARHLLLRRLTSAMRSLETTNVPLKNIAFGCGFSSSNYFSYAFKRENGITPREYRKLHNDPIRSQPETYPFNFRAKQKKR